ncbi:MAG: hypothetical protein LBT30_02190 [Clostridiales bacterium]|jgi:Mg2+ and Co2+ transporter CorA|nr:hypothetical protein [Clostridiales bacterium]
MADIRTRKERETLWANSIRQRGRKPYRFEREAWLEFMVVEDVRDKYLEKMSLAKDSVAAKETKVAYLEEKIRLTSSSKEKFQYAQEIADLKDDLEMLRGEVSDFEYTYNLLKELCSVAKRLINKERFWDVVMALPEHKLQRLAREEDGLEYIRELVEKICKELQEVELRNAERREIYRKQKKHMKNVHDEANKLIGNMQQDDLAKIIREAEACATEIAEDTAAEDTRKPNKA